MQPAPTMEGALLGSEEAAALLRIKQRTVQAMAKRGELPCVRFGKRIIRFDPADLRRWIDGRKSGPNASCSSASDLVECRNGQA